MSQAHPGAAAWEIRGTIEVLYTSQKVAKRPKFREGSLRLCSGRAALFDDAGREIDGETLTGTLLQQLRARDELDFPGHIVQPQAAMAGESPCPCTTTEMGQSTESTQDSVTEHKVRQPFKRPRVAAIAPAREVSQPVQPMQTSQKDVQIRSVQTAHAQSPVIDGCPNLWQQAVEEDARALETPAAVDLWMNCVEEDTKFTCESTPMAYTPKKLQCTESSAQDSREPPTPKLSYGEHACSASVSSGPQVYVPIPSPCRTESIGTSHAMAHVQECELSNSEDEMLLRVPLPTASGHQSVEAASDDDLPLQSLITKSASGKAEGIQSSCAASSALGSAEQAPAGQRKVKMPRRVRQTCQQGQQGQQNIGQQHGRKPSQKKPSVGKGGGLSPAIVFAPLPLSFTENSGPITGPPSPTSFANSAAYSHHFVQVLLGDIQARLSDLANSWHRSHVDLSGLPPEISVVVRGVLVGRTLGPIAQDAEAHGDDLAGVGPVNAASISYGFHEQSRDSVQYATFIFGNRTSVPRGSLRACARGDLWILLPPGTEPLIFRSLWRGVSPRGRLLCVAANTAASLWLQQSHERKLTGLSGFATGAFSHELEQLDALRASAECCKPGLDDRGGPEAFDNDRFLCTLLGARQHVLQSRPQSARTSELPIPSEAETPQFSGLNQQQRNVLGHVAAWASDGGDPHAVLVRGVFGSGKSRTLAASISLLDRLLSSQKDPRRILLLCQTNVAVDNVLHILLSQGWDDFARLGSFRSVEPALLHRTVSLMATRQAASKELSEALERLPPEVAKSLQDAVERGVIPPRAQVWRRRRLVAATTAALHAGDHLGPEAFRCAFVFVDEATQLTEPAVFACLRKASVRRVLLVGDPRQLPPRTRHVPLARSMLERLWDDGPAAARVELTMQYRCHPDLANLPSTMFYGEGLQSGVLAQDRSSIIGPRVPPLIVFLSEGNESRFGHSYRHTSEAQLCAAWVQRVIVGNGLKAADFGIVCLYRPQAEACARELASAAPCRGVEAATVDAFQGAEREIVVLSCGRSMPAAAGDVFATCPRRLNVAMSRSRRHLVVFGSEAFLRQHVHLSRLFEAACMYGSVHPARAIHSM